MQCAAMHCNRLYLNAQPSLHAIKNASGLWSAQGTRFPCSTNGQTTMRWHQNLHSHFIPRTKPTIDLLCFLNYYCSMTQRQASRKKPNTCIATCNATPGNAYVEQTLCMQSSPHKQRSCYQNCLLRYMSVEPILPTALQVGCTALPTNPSFAHSLVYMGACC